MTIGLRRRVAATAVVALVAGATAARADLGNRIGRAKAVVAGTVADVASYESGRFTVADVAVSSVLHGDFAGERAAVVERHDRPSSPQLLPPRALVVLLLSPARRSSSLEKALPPAEYYEIPGDVEGVLATDSAAEFEEIVTIVGRMIEARTRPAKEAGARARRARALVFDEIAARHARLVVDGAQGLSTIVNLAETLAPEEQARLANAVQRNDLPEHVRIRLVDAFAENGLRTMVPALRSLAQPGPELQRAVWRAMRKLGEAPTLEDLQVALASSNPETREAAVESLVATFGAGARERLEDLARQDPDEGVRLAAIEALGQTGVAALPALEGLFTGKDWAQRRAVGRAISTIGGRDAAESFGRLAFDGPSDARKFAVTLLLMTGISREDPLVQRIARSHPDESVRHLAESGLEVHDH